MQEIISRYFHCSIQRVEINGPIPCSTKQTDRPQTSYTFESLTLTSRGSGRDESPSTMCTSSLNQFGDAFSMVLNENSCSRFYIDGRVRSSASAPPPMVSNGLHKHAPEEKKRALCIR